jgi:hypothetical protein
MKKLALIVLLSVGIGLGLSAVLDVVAHADTAGATTPDDPTGTLAQLVGFARSGKGRLAFGSALVLVVWGMRTLVSPRVQWFKTTAGGYTLSFSTTAVAYLGTSLSAGLPVTLDLLADMIATAFAASGKWEALRDALTSLGKKPPAAGAVAGAVVALLVVGVATANPGCATLTGSGKKVEAELIDCAKQDIMQRLGSGAGIDLLLAVSQAVMSHDTTKLDNLGKQVVQDAVACAVKATATVLVANPSQIAARASSPDVAFAVDYMSSKGWRFK